MVRDPGFSSFGNDCLDQLPVVRCEKKVLSDVKQLVEIRFYSITSFDVSFFR